MVEVIGIRIESVGSLPPCQRAPRFKMQDPNEDTEWNDVLRAKGIIPEKPKEKEVTEEELVQMLESTIKEKTGGEH